MSLHPRRMLQCLRLISPFPGEFDIVADGMTKDILADAKSLEAHGLEKP